MDTECTIGSYSLCQAPSPAAQTTVGVGAGERLSVMSGILDCSLSSKALVCYSCTCRGKKGVNAARTGQDILPKTPASIDKEPRGSKRRFQHPWPGLHNVPSTKSSWKSCLSVKSLSRPSKYRPSTHGRATCPSLGAFKATMDEAWSSLV